MVQPRPKSRRPDRLKRPMQAYIRACRKVALATALIAEIARIAREAPGMERAAARYLPAWVRPMALEGAPPPRPDMWAYYRQGLGRRGRRALARQGPWVEPRARAPDPAAAPAPDAAPP